MGTYSFWIAADVLGALALGFGLDVLLRFLLGAAFISARTSAASRRRGVIDRRRRRC
jgi:hypothetical protein